MIWLNLEVLQKSIIQECIYQYTSTPVEKYSYFRAMIS